MTYFIVVIIDNMIELITYELAIEDAEISFLEILETYVPDYDKFTLEKIEELLRKGYVHFKHGSISMVIDDPTDWVSQISERIV